jgi:4-amino-4-deoxy-L-arabinose transferase-like glycosyltransferase
MTTDTPLLLCAAVALLLQHRLAAAPSAAAAVALGLAVGLGVLAKYAMAYAVAGMALAALVAPAWRIGARDAALAAAVASAVVAPHLWWLAAEAFVTVRHVADDALWQGPRIDAGSALGFWAAQAAVMGPVLWGAWHLGLATARRAGGGIAGLAAASAVPVAVVLAQALTSRVLANWAVVFVAAGVILAARALHGRRAWQAISLALGLAVAVALPVVKVAGTEWQRPDGRLLLSRYAGQADLAATVATAARAQGAARLVAADREVLAALTWELRGQGFDVRATPDAGPARHHWDLARPWAPAPGPALMVLRAGDAAPCAGRPVQTFTAGPGFVQGRMFVLTALDGAACPAGGAPP